MFRLYRRNYFYLSLPFIFLARFASAASDPGFDQCINETGETNGWTEFSEYTKLECSEAGISDVSELDQFPNLGLLVLEGNNISSLNVSGNPELFHININNNAVTSLDISNNSNLSVLLAANNQLTGLATSSNEALAVLSLGGNNISSLDFSANPNLARVYIHNNQLSTLDISNNQGIFEMTAGNNSLTSINLGPSGSLHTLGLANNQLTTLDITGHGLITYLNVEGNPLDFETTEFLFAIEEEAETLDKEFTLLIDGEKPEDITFTDANFEKCINDTAEANGWNAPPDVTSLDCANAGITDVGELSHFTNLGTLNLSGNSISSIDLAANTALFNLNVNGNDLTSLNISSNTTLSVLQAADNQLGSLDLSANSALNVLSVGSNNLETLDLSNNENLTRIFVQDNSLNTLDISNNNGVSELVAGNNRLSTITLGTGALVTLGLANNDLTTLDITGHGLLGYVNVEGNPLDSDTVGLLTGIAEEAGESFTLLIDALKESIPLPEAPVPAASKITTVGGSNRDASFGLGAYSDSGSPTYGNDFSAGEFITLYGTVTPDAVDVGIDGELYAALLSIVDGKASFSFINEDGNFEAWNTSISGLGPYKIVTPLEESHQFRIFEGNLQAGIYKITFAYKAQGGPLVFMKPLTLKVAN